MSDTTKSADPLPWFDGHGLRWKDAGMFSDLRCCERHFAPRPEFGFTEGNDK